ncbi:small metal-binding protein SmbP [Nitrosospira multiformis]|uniref:small metal-binding protein SmbP n=1 Tax=Nitrosospira multiformis TaxID=1231 RepID=UPI000D32069F
MGSFRKRNMIWKHMETFEEMDKAIGEAKKGHFTRAAEAVRRASVHLKQKARSK